MFTRIMCDGVKVGLRFISDCKTDNNKSVKSFEMKMPYFDEMHYNDKNFVINSLTINKGGNTRLFLLTICNRKQQINE